MTKKKTTQDTDPPTELVSAESAVLPLQPVVDGAEAGEKIYFISCLECRKHWQEYGYATPCGTCEATQCAGMPVAVPAQVDTFEISVEQAIQIMRDQGFEVFLDVKIDDCKEETGAKRRSFQRQGRYDVVLARGRRRV